MVVLNYCNGDGSDLKLISVAINGNRLIDGVFQVASQHFIVKYVLIDNFILKTFTENLLQKKTFLEMENMTRLYVELGMTFYPVI
nr:puromycin-sensitive aminopeptidase-like isoform X2 [Tanacetum cinerariifolium]